MSELLPEGESLRRAVRWLSDQIDRPDHRPVHKLIDEAALRFDLTPLEVEFLQRQWARDAARK